MEWNIISICIAKRENSEFIGKNALIFIFE